MVRKADRPLREDSGIRVRVLVQGEDELAERYATNLSQGALFIQQENPPAVGSMITVEFVLPDGTLLSRNTAKIVHSKTGLIAGEKTAGMGLEFVHLDEFATDVVERFNANRSQSSLADAVPASSARDRIDVLRPMGHAPMISISGPVVGMDLGTVNSCVAMPGLIFSRGAC